MPEIQDIFNHVHIKSMSPDQAKAFNMIRHCRTSSLGSHSEVCTECGTVEVSYNSCRNRHCPKCQHSVQEQWVEAQMSKLLPVGYFHVVFTIPQELNILVLQNQELLYSLLIRSAGHTLIELAKDPKYLGATIGVTSVGLRFVRSRKKFFIPVKVISEKFKGKFLYYLKKAFEKGKTSFFNDAARLSSMSNFSSLVDSLYLKDWVVFCKKPFKSPAHVVRYLGRYTHRVAIGNSRILAFDGRSVSFSWKDYKDGNISKVMTLDAKEFARRFLLHVLPTRFTKIRHYGIMCSRYISTKLSKCMKLAGKSPFKLTAQKYIKTCRSCGSQNIIMFFPKHSCSSP